jgi:hypothetical protein
VADVGQGVPVNAEIQNRIRADGLGSPHPRLPLTHELEPDELYHPTSRIIDYCLTASHADI